MSGSRGVAWIDPARIHRNLLPPPVSIQSISVNHVLYDPGATIRFPVLPSNIQIDYNAPSLSIPARVRFRYQLENYDKDWQDPGTRRSAFYGELPPGEYRFHVIACNNDGVWNSTGATMQIIVPPSFYQALWFRLLGLAAGGVALWMIYLMRLRQVSAAIQSRFEERLTERTRIARELHDTLLQGFLSASM
jgi:hypothetical protein